MFARHLTMQLKRGMVSEFPRVMDEEILPLLRKQKGFLEELILVAPNELDTVAMSLWEEKEDAVKFNRDAYPEILKILDKYVKGTPMLKDFEVKFATIPAFQKFAKVTTV